MAIITSDGRDITKEEWRVVPGFKKYKVTKDGDVWSRTKRILLKEYEHPTNGRFYYYLVDDDGKNTTRSFQALVDLAYPELAAPKTQKIGKKPPTYLSKSDWVEIPGFPKFQIHPSGTIRTTKQRKNMKHKINSLTGKPYFSMVDPEGTWAISIEDLLTLAFSNTNTEEQVAA